MATEQPFAEGYYLETIKGKVGTGHTSKDAVSKNYWYAKPGEEGCMSATLLDIHYEPTGYVEQVEFEEFGDRFEYLKDFQPPKSQAKREQADKVAARAERHLAKEEFLSAEYEFGNALKMDAENVRANFGLGKTYLAQGETEKAKEQFGKLSEVDAMVEPQYKHIFNEFGIKLRQLGMYSEAVTHYERALRIEDKDEHLWFNLGRAHYEGGNLRQAAAALRKALEINPDFEEARMFLQGLAAQKS